MNKLYINLLTVSAVAIMGCGGGSSSSNSDDGFKIHQVAYTLNGTQAPTCPNADITQSDVANITTCTWKCGNYQGSVLTVNLIFGRSGKDTIWELNNELLRQAPKECHN